MVLLCIDDDFSNAENDLVRKLFAERRDDFFPKKGLTYETKETSYLYDKTAYKLRELKSPEEEFGLSLFFYSDRFIDLNIFKPDYIDENGNGVRVETMHVSFNIDTEMFDFKDGESITFTHNGDANEE